MFGEIHWKAIDRDRDGNTGLIYATRDTPGAATEAQYSYDVLGRLTEISPAGTEYPSQVVYVGLQQTILRQGARALIETKNSCASGDGVDDYVMSCYHYDKLGRLVKTERRPYDGNLGYPYQTKSYDILDRVTFESEWLWPGDPVVGTTYDYADPIATSQRDPLGRPRKITPADSTPAMPRDTLIDYFGNSRRVKVRGVRTGVDSETDVVTTYHNDSWGRLVHVEAPAGADAYYAYDLRGNLVRVDLLDKANWSFQTRQFEYDALNRLRVSMNPESGTEIIGGMDCAGAESGGYDALGNIVERRDAAGNRLTAIFDGAGRLVKQTRRSFRETSCPGSSPVTLLEQKYDEIVDETSWQFGHSLGRLTRVFVRDDGGSGVMLTQKLKYEGLNGRLSTDRSEFSGWGSVGAPMVYEYNDFGQIRRTTYPEGPAGKGGAFSTTHIYRNGYPMQVWDTVDWIANPNQPGLAQARAIYNAAGGFQEILTPDSGRTVILPDERNRPKRITISGQPGSLLDLGPYSYDGAGNIYRVGPNNKYAYDAANRLVAAEDLYDGIVRNQTYQYDDLGNMTVKTYHVSGSQVGNDVFTVRDQTSGWNANRILTLQQLGDTGVRIFDYDARGNLTLSSTQTAKQRHTYDSRNRLVSSRSVAGSIETGIGRYAYDGSSNRFRKEDLGLDLWTFYVRDGQGRLMSEFRRARMGDYEPEWTKHYIYLGDRLVGLRENLVPTPPGYLKATTSRFAKTVTLTWKASPQGEGSTISRYRIYRAPVSTSVWEIRGTTTNLTYTDSVTVNVLYKYVVSACTGDCPTSQGDPDLESYGQGTLVILAGDMLIPTPPTGLQAKPSDRRVDLKWSPNPGTENVVGYHVYRVLGTGTPSRITQDPVVGVAYPDQGVRNGMSYRYSISAVDTASLESGRSAEVTVSPLDDVPPGPPGGMIAQADCGGTSVIRVAWDANVTTDGIHYFVLFRQPPFASGQSQYIANTSTSYEDTQTQPGVSYEYWVKSVDAQGNLSEESLHVGATARHPAGTVAPPTLPFAHSGDGRIDLRIVVSPDTATLPTVKVYRKRNVELACDAYQYLGAVPTNPQVCVGTGTAQRCFVDFTDADAPSNIAYDYAVTNVDNLGRESTYSTTALAVPLAQPGNYSECIDAVGTAPLQGSTNCPWAYHPINYNRIAVSWESPPTPAYQPLVATDAGGELGYLKGVRIYRYKKKHGSGSTGDYSSMTAQRLESQMGHCSKSPEIACDISACPAGAGTCQKHDQYPDPDTGKCSVSLGTCMLDTDCPTGELCVSRPTDPYLVMYGDERFYTDFTQGSFGAGCLSAKHVYKVFANGDWLTLESDFTDNFDETQRADNLSRCIRLTPQVCDQFPPPGFPELTRPFCPKVTQRPPVPAKPTATSPTPGEIVVTWAAPLPGVCQLVNPASCQDQTPGPCQSTNQFCSIEDGYKCRLTSPQRCTTSADCPTSSAQVCVPVESQVAGYRLYVSELPILPQGGSTYESWRYHATRPVPFVTLRGEERSYTLRGLSRCQRRSINPIICERLNSFSFRVASVDLQGRVSDASVPSDRVTPLQSQDPIGAPGSLKRVIWTVSDATTSQVEEGGNPTANPREMEGIKLNWLSKFYPNLIGFRLYRSLTPGGPYCALIREGGGTGLTICPGDRSTGPYAAYSDTVTTGPTGSNHAFVDVTALQGITYHYVVTALTSAGESPLSGEVAALAMEHPTQPLSPPRYFKAWAPDYHFAYSAPQDYPEHDGVYLRWCPNPAVEAVTEYQIYRAIERNSPKGPFAPFVKVPPVCLYGNHRCEIGLVGGQPTLTAIKTPPDCQPGMTGNCRIIDLTVTQPSGGIDTQIYNYVVTALRGAQESGFSTQNEAWPNYAPFSQQCTTYYPQGSPPFMVCDPRYDPDNFPDAFCGDEISSMSGEAVWVADAASRGTSSSEPDVVRSDETALPVAAPYRVIGQSGVQPPAPNASPRFIYYHLDHLGSPRVILSASGVVVSRHHYMPFGEEVPIEVMQSSNKRHFTGHERDGESGLDYMLARYYSSSLGRFMAVDPGNDSQLEDPQSWNKYAYVGNNPISYVDPDGRFKKKHHREIGRAHGQSRQEARDVANVDNALGGALPCCDAVFRSGTHFPTEEKIQQLLNEAAEAWARGDFETVDFRTFERCS